MYILAYSRLITNFESILTELNPHRESATTILNSIHNPESSIHNPESTIFLPRPSILNSQPSIKLTHLNPYEKYTEEVNEDLQKK